MKIIKLVKFALVVAVIVVSTSCNPEEVNPKEVDGASQTETPVVVD